MNDMRINKIASKIARLEKFDANRVKKFRNDYLIFMKNLPKIDSYDKAMLLNGYMVKWRQDFDDYIFKYLMNYLERLKNSGQVTEWLVDDFENNIRKDVWEFVIDFQLPISRADDYWTKEQRFNQYLNDIKSWESRNRRNARKSWKILLDFIEWNENAVSSSPVVNVFEKENVKIEGFEVSIVGQGDFDGASSKTMQRLADEKFDLFIHTLSEYRKQAKKFFPLLLKKKLPIEANFKGKFGESAGEYEFNRIVIYPFSIDNNIRKVVHIIAHEMGHHIYRTYLSSEDKKLFNKYLNGSRERLDLNEVVKKYSRKGMILSDSLEKENPLLYRQLEGLTIHQPVSEYKNIWNWDELEEKLNSGASSVVVVYTTPISGYASKNDEEAFCEAVGMWVAYGPNVLTEEVRATLQTIIPIG